MTEEKQEKQEGQKTVVAFIAGLLIGGLLVWVFSDAPSAEAPKPAADEETVEETTSDVEASEDGDSQEAAAVTTTDVPEVTMAVGDGSVVVRDQAASQTIELESVTFPTDEGWIGVRSYANGQLGSLLGVMRYSKDQGLVPEAIELQVPTTAGREYAVVFYTENGDLSFSLAEDVQIDEVFATFSAK